MQRSKIWRLIVLTSRACLYGWFCYLVIGLYLGWSQVVVVHNPPPVPWWKWALLLAVAIGVGLSQRHDLTEKRRARRDQAKD